ncbi:helix-turn-helix domain-containing protein [Paenibacillus pinistramenti]|uniref:helix-turn-helix domain-containing protein n=1 Tax=Paenibacillus pinistramenti TaxID=1768003 RepID=UPI001107F762|nr:helix-turn-helix domain-containing protein [Paenibacillus pinistramenti]
MKLNYFKSRLFLKYISSYLLILMLPLALLTVIIYNSAVNNLRGEIEQSHLNQLNQTKSNVDHLVQQLYDIASRVSYDEQLTRYQAHDPYYGRYAINALENYKSANSLIHEMFLYFHNDNSIFSPSGMSGLQVFTDKFSFRNWDSESVLQDLNEVKFPSVRPVTLAGKNGSLNQSMLAFLVPITPNSPNPHGTLMFLVKESELTALINSILGNYQGSSFIFDNNGQVLASNYNHEGALSEPDLKSLTSLTPGIHSIRLGGEANSVVSVKSGQNGWEFVTLMQSSQFFSSVLHIRSLILMIFFAVLAAGSLAALLLARKQYNPIFDLVQFANSKGDQAAEQILHHPGSGKNELDRIKSALHEYSSRADLQEPYARNHFLLMLLKYGNLESLPPELAKSIKLHFKGSRHVVIVAGRSMLGEGSSGLSNGQSVISALCASDFGEYNACVHCVELPKPDQIALIVSFNPFVETSEQDQVRLIAQAIQERISSAFELHSYMGVGSSYDSPGQLNQSFIEACSAFDSRVSAGDGSITFFEELAESPIEAGWISKNLLLKLSQSLKQGSYTVAVQTVDEAVRDLQQAGFCLKLARCVYFDIVNTIIKTGLELGVSHLVRDIPPVETLQSAGELSLQLRALCSRICLWVEQNEKKEEHSLMDEIISYIDSSYMDHALSLESISSKYSISVSHFSRSFKESAGTNFVQYIWQKRIADAIHKLTTTNEPLKDIILTVGYQDTPNFIRKFKKETGHTPGQYRKLFSQKGEAVKAANAVKAVKGEQIQA